MYVRTSSAANVGEDKDSEPRQLERCKAYAAAKGWTIVAVYRDPAVSGTDALIRRAGFAQCATHCQKKNVKYILVESGDRFARNLIVQETGLTWLQEMGVQLISAQCDSQFTQPSAVPQEQDDTRSTTPGALR